MGEQKLGTIVLQVLIQDHERRCRGCISKISGGISRIGQTLRPPSISQTPRPPPPSIC